MEIIYPGKKDIPKVLEPTHQIPVTVPFPEGDAEYAYDHGHVNQDARLSLPFTQIKDVCVINDR